MSPQDHCERRGVRRDRPTYGTDRARYRPDSELEPGVSAVSISPTTNPPEPGAWSDTRRAVLRIVLIAVLQTAGLLVVYYLMPVATHDRSFAMRFVGSATLVALVFVWQVKRVITAKSRLFRSLTSLGLAIPLVVVVYSGLYLTVSLDNPAAFSEVLGKTDALYFTVTTLATVGYGDISPSSDLARIVAMTQMVANVTLIGFSVRIVSGMASNLLRDRRSRQPDGGQATSKDESPEHVG